MAHTIYNIFKEKVMTGAINFATDSFKVMLVSSLYTPDKDSHHSYVNISNEVTGLGYSAGGQLLTGVTVMIDLVNNEARLWSNEATWINSTITASGAVIYKVSSDPTQAWLVNYFDFNAQKSSYVSDFIFQAASEILTLS